jgi:hypothetical protein
VENIVWRLNYPIVNYINRLVTTVSRMKRLIIVVCVLLYIVACGPTIDPEDCSTYTDQGNKDNCYFEKAIASADVDICGDIEMSPLKTVCISEIGIALNDLEVCGSLEEDENAQGSCYAKIAVNNEDENICKEISSEYWLNICYFDMGTMKDKEELCLKVKEEKRADKCFMDVSVDKTDASICSYIEEVILKDDCYKEVAILKQDVQICEKMSNELNKEAYCMKTIAEESEDVSICNKLTIKKVRDRCIEVVEEGSGEDQEIVDSE